MEKKTIKRALVISGGGAKGAWGGGFLQYKIDEEGYDWDMYFGTSTGSLLITLTSLQEMARLKEAYTSADSDAIFSVNPFTKKGNINWFNAVKRTIQGKTSLGETGNLPKIIKNMFTETDFEITQKSGKKLYPCATDYITKSEKYVCNLDTDYETYVNFTHASTSVPVATDFVKIGDMCLLDGGVVTHIPIQKAIDEGAEEVDIIVFRPEFPVQDDWKPKSWFDTLLRTTDIQENQISKNNVLIGQLEARDKDVLLRFRYTPTVLTTNSLVFTKAEMLKWWAEGYEYAKKENTSKKMVILHKRP
jgi:predicted patatin/cPLA2 family phospholipase